MVKPSTMIQCRGFTNKQKLKKVDINQLFGFFKIAS